MEAQIEIGFSNNIYNNPADVVASARLISEYFQAVEIELAEEAQSAVFDVPPAQYDGVVDSLLKLADERSLNYCVHAAWYGPATDLTSDNAEERSASIALLARSIRFAADICAPIVTCHPGYHHGQDKHELVDKLADAMEQLENLLDSANVTLCLENMGAHRPAQVVLTSEDQWTLFKRCGTSVCLDMVHLASIHPEEQELYQAIREIMPLVKHVHLADTVRPAHRHLPIGKGDLPLDGVLSVLKEEGYSGLAIIEEFNRGWSPEEYLSGGLELRDRARTLAVAV